MSAEQNDQNKPSKIKRIVGKFDFLSTIALVLIVLALLSSLFKASK
jgi:hypothetical protein